jgi:peroxiredoxin Q/BCP
MIRQGDAAPDFTLPRDGGATVTLSALRPKKVVLYFYPKDDTPGCTLEGQDFTRLKAEFDAAHTLVLGVSKDSVKSHDKFCQKYGLGVTLVSDEGSDVCERYGVWQEKSMYGKKYMGIARTTFLIGADGRVARVWEKVSVPDHAKEVLAAAEAL